MVSGVRRITLKIIELIGCIACVIMKTLTDQEARRVFILNQKLSREWSLLNNITWSREGNAFSNVTYGGFTLITTLMLISRCVDPTTRPSLLEKIFLTTGMLCFFSMGGLVLAAFDQVPSDLHDNAIILGCLSFLVAFVMLFDLADPMIRRQADSTQTDSVQEVSITLPSEDATESHPHDVYRTRIRPDDEVNVIVTNGNYQRTNDVNVVKTQIFPIAQSPVFEKILLPEKQRSYRKFIPNPHNYSSEYINHDAGYNANEMTSKITVMPTYEPTSYVNSTQRYDSQAFHTSYKNNNSNQNQNIFEDSHLKDLDSCSGTQCLKRAVTPGITTFKKGFVAQAARMWDSRIKQKQSLDTIV